mmetsp:Transcript_13652/g.17218  ORF Transcript_13652/g.17218 Transcript_13652/m.17218 type:complete len:492 (-) Transcript_13652:76-1551(-)
MPSANAELSDLQKALEALSFITSIRSIDDLFGVFGLHNLPVAQKYGIFFGCGVFTITIITVITLLIMGGSFKRIAEQEKTGGGAIPGSIEERVNRPLLLERLIESQERMVKNYPSETLTENLTNLTKMLLNIAPDVARAKKLSATLIEEEDSNGGKKDEIELKKKQAELKKFIPDGYEANYIKAYRKCQDKPGGPILSGMPEARYEAYARAFAGCGIYTSASYRRSYARMYEAVAAKNHGSEKMYREHWFERPGDIVGRLIRLEPMDVDRHLQPLFDMTCGDVYNENRAFDPQEVWGFLDDGPFRNSEEMRKSFVFQRRINEAGFAILESITDKMIGVIFLTNDNPKNLTISLEIPIVKPSSEGTAEQIEACFLLLDRLFALGYRRVQLSVDSMDTRAKKLAGRLGFTQEGLIPKERVVKESNRDSIIYGMLNSDWDKGARSFLFKKLHGEKILAAQLANEKKEDEAEEQEIFLAKEKEKANEDAIEKKNK